MQIDTVVFFQITDPKLFTYGVERPLSAIENLSATTLRNIIGDMELDHTLTSRDTINTKITAILDEATDKWGIKVNRVEVKNIIPPAEIQDAMEKQMKAERQRRESILRAEGEKKSAILVAEGEKESAILRADAVREQRIRAKGLAEAEAIRAKAVAEAEGIEKKAEAMTKMGKAAVLEMYFNALPDVVKNAAEPLTKVDKITMYGDGNSAKLTRDIMQTVTQVTDGLKESTGVDLQSVLSGFLGGKLADAAQPAPAAPSKHPRAPKQNAGTPAE